MNPFGVPLTKQPYLDLDSLGMIAYDEVGCMSVTTDPNWDSGPDHQVSCDCFLVCVCVCVCVCDCGLEDFCALPPCGFKIRVVASAGSYEISHTNPYSSRLRNDVDIRLVHQLVCSHTDQHLFQYSGCTCTGRIQMACSSADSSTWRTAVVSHLVPTSPPNSSYVVFAVPSNL